MPDQFTPLWKWRASVEGKSNNGLSEGEKGPREMNKIAMAERKYHLSVSLLVLTIRLGEDFKFEKVSIIIS